jgi:hypothetical protein
MPAMLVLPMPTPPNTVLSAEETIAATTVLVVMIPKIIDAMPAPPTTDAGTIVPFVWTAPTRTKPVPTASAIPRYKNITATCLSSRGASKTNASSVKDEKR